MTSRAPTQQVRVARRRVEAEGVAGFDLVAADGGALAPFTAGAHIDVHLEGGLLRSYSLCNDPRDARRYQLAVLREPASRGGSAAMHALREGQVLQISLPRNHFPLATGASRHLLLAGGIGITPLLAMAWQLAGEGAAFELHYASRSVARTAFTAALHDVPWAGHVRLHHDDGDTSQRLDLPALLARPQPGTHLYVCGPAGFIEAALSAAHRAGWPEDSLHREFFGAGTPVDVDGEAFEVQVASTGLVVPVAAGQSVVAALGAAGVAIPVSCEQGICGTCLTRVIDGRPDHRDQYLTDTEREVGDQFLPCCSRSHSPRLVIDL